MLWQLWELLITETPLLIVGEDPTECSHAVLILLSLISPLRTNADYRPYITIYDPDTREIQASFKKNHIKNLILGVSNPYLITFFGEFPAVFHFDRQHFIEKKFQCPKDVDITTKTKNTNSISKEIQYSLVSKHKLLMKPSKIALKHLNIDKSVEESLAINNLILRKHFKVLTESFLSSFNNFLKINYAIKGTGDIH